MEGESILSGGDSLSTSTTTAATAGAAAVGSLDCVVSTIVGAKESELLTSSQLITKTGYLGVFVLFCCFVTQRNY